MDDHIKVNFDKIYVSKEVYVQDGKAQVRYILLDRCGV